MGKATHDFHVSPSGQRFFWLVVRLVDAAKLALRPSLWNIWAFVDVLYWQLKEALKMLDSTRKHSRHGTRKAEPRQNILKFGA